MQIVNFLLAHGADILTVIGALVTAATTIVALTPSKRDDEIVSEFRSILERFSILDGRVPPPPPAKPSPAPVPKPPVA